jgi:hypothetical protein
VGEVIEADLTLSAMSLISQRKPFDDTEQKTDNPSLNNLSSLNRSCRRRLMRRAAPGLGGCGWSKQQSSKNQNACSS